MKRNLLLLSLMTALGAGCGSSSNTPADSGVAMDSSMGTDASTGMDGATGGCGTGGEVMITADIGADTTWTCDKTYVLTDHIFVTGASTLTIEAGTTILGESGAALLAAQGSRLVAVGTADAPIVFTSANPVGARATGDWAGVALIGNSTINKGSCVGDGDPATEACDAPGYLQGHIEGIDVTDLRGSFGGRDEASDCGHLEYVRIEFAGAELSPNNELNGLTVAACGSGTTLRYLQVHRGKDDAIEFFGGTASMDHIVTSGSTDDNLDCDLGWRGNVQFMVIHQFAGIGDNGIECDNATPDMDSQPRTHGELWNFTMIGTPDTRGMVLREGVSDNMHNFIIQDFGAEAFDVRDTASVANWPATLAIENSVFWNNGPSATETGADDDDGGFDESAMAMDAARVNSFSVDPMLGSSSITSPDYMPGASATDLAGATPPAGFDTGATYVGAVEPGGTDWTTGWTAFPEN